MRQRAHISCCFGLRSYAQEDQTKLKLLYANRTPTDTLLLAELQELQRKHPQQLEIRYLVEQEGQNEQPAHAISSDEGANKDGTFTLGRPRAETIRGFLPSPFEPQTAVLVCGPEGMMQALCGNGMDQVRDGGVPRLGGMLRGMGYGRQVVQFSDTSAV